LCRNTLQQQGFDQDHSLADMRACVSKQFRLDAGEEIIELAETLQAPVVSFRSGRGIVSDDSDLGLSVVAGHKLWQETDVLLGIGTRLDVPSRLWRHPPKGQKVLRVDIDPVEKGSEPSRWNFIYPKGVNPISKGGKEL